MESKRMSHFELTGRLKDKIDVFAKNADGSLRYLGSTNWHRTCKDALRAFQAVHGSHVATVARFNRRT